MALEAILSGIVIDALNFSPDSKSLSVREIVEIARANWPIPTSVEFLDGLQSENIEAISLQLDSRVARDILNWNPLWGQEESVIATFEWWDKVLNKSISPRKACQSDIDYLLST